MIPSMVNRLRSIVQDDFIRHNAVFFVGSMLVAVLNYLYHPIMSRMMSVEDFGEVQALFSLLTQLGIPLGIFNMIALNLYTNQHTHDSPSVQQFSLLTLYVAGISALGILIATPYLVTAFKLHSAWSLVLVAATLIVSAATTFGRSYLQANQHFTTVSVSNIIGAGGKLICAVVLVLLGYATLGALGGFLIASIATYLYVQSKAGVYIALPETLVLRYTPTLARELRYSVLILFGTALIAFFSTADVIIAKYFFSAETAGIYSGVSVIARILFFATGSIAAVLLSHIKLSESPATNHHFLVKGLVLTALIGGAGLLILSLAPRFIITFMVGEKYAPLAFLLPILALHTFILSLISVFINYALALRKKSVIVISTVGTIATFVLLASTHGTPQGIAWGFLGGSTLTLLACAITYLKTDAPSYDTTKDQDRDDAIILDTTSVY